MDLFGPPSIILRARGPLRYLLSFLKYPIRFRNYLVGSLVFRKFSIGTNSKVEYGPFAILFLSNLNDPVALLSMALVFLCSLGRP